MSKRAKNADLWPKIEGVGDDEERARRRAQFEAGRQFIRERGGQRWIGAYVKPYYLEWMG